MPGSALAPFDVRGRIERLRRTIADQGVDAVVVSDLVSVRWATGFTGSNGVVYVSADEVVLVTDGRYAHQAPMELEDAGLDASVKIASTALDELAPLAGGKRVAVEAEHLSWADHRRYSAALEGELTPLGVPIVTLRAVKDAGELDRTRLAASIADAALAEVASDIPGRSERDVARELDHAMRLHGATASAYETIVASGPNAALPHARPTERVIEAGDLVIVDVGALYDGYRSDMTRTFVVGEASAEQQRWLDVVAEAQRAGVEAVVDGAEARVVDDACRAVISAAGMADHFVHGTGHGVGLDIHEHPRVSSRSEDVLREGMLVTVEPGVYVAGVGGVRWEDLHIVTSEGAVAVTASPKQPVLV